MGGVVLTGVRVVVRLASAADVPSIVAYYRRNRRHLARWEPVRPRAFYTLAHWKKQVRTNRSEWRVGRSLRMFLFERSRPRRVIGSVNLSNIVRGVFHACHLGYSLDGESQGRGLMTEALRLAMAHAFGEMNLNRAMANYIPRNRRSARLLRRLGFRGEGRARHYLLIDGRWEDHVLTSRIHTGWRPQEARPEARPGTRR